MRSLPKSRWKPLWTIKQQTWDLSLHIANRTEPFHKIWNLLSVVGHERAIGQTGQRLLRSVRPAQSFMEGFNTWGVFLWQFSTVTQKVIILGIQSLQGPQGDCGEVETAWLHFFIPQNLTVLTISWFGDRKLTALLRWCRISHICSLGVRSWRHMGCSGVEGVRAWKHPVGLWGARQWHGAPCSGGVWTGPASPLWCLGGPAVCKGVR